MKRLPFLFLTVILLFCCCRQRKREIAQNLLGWDKEIVESAEVKKGETSRDSKRIIIPIPSNPSGDLPPNNNARLKEYFNDSNYIQYMAAERLGIKPITSLGLAYNTARPIVEIESGEHFTVDRLTHSMPYLVPEAATLLDEIGAEFSERTKKAAGKEGYKVIVTSLLRTPSSVKSLRRVNRNATDSSTHMFATTFDLSWSHFDSPDTVGGLSGEQMKMILADILRVKRDEGRCFVKYEIKSPCFHVTVAK